MNLIEKVAKAIDKIASERGFPVHKVVVHHLAGAAIEAMPSIKWQKIETLPEEYKESNRPFLAWHRSDYCRKLKYQKDDYYKRVLTEDSCYENLNNFTHWAEINAPEDE